MFTYNDLSCLTKDLPSIAVLSDLPGTVIERLASTLSKCGANIFMFNMTNKIGYKQSMQRSPFQRIIPNDNGKDFVYKSSVAQNLVLKKHPNFIKEYEFYWCGNGLHIPLQDEKTFQSCGLALIYESAPLLIDAEKFSKVLAGKQSIMRCGSPSSFTGFCSYTAGCAKWQTSGCADCPILGLTATGKDMCAEHFARKQAGFADMRALSVVTPSRWLNREMQRSILGVGFHYSVIPTNVPLDVFCPMPKALALEHLGIPDDRPIILVGSNGLRKNKGGICSARLFASLTGIGASCLRGFWLSGMMLLFLIKYALADWKPSLWAGFPIVANSRTPMPLRMFLSARRSRTICPIRSMNHLPAARLSSVLTSSARKMWPLTG